MRPVTSSGEARQGSGALVPSEPAAGTPPASPAGSLPSLHAGGATVQPAHGGNLAWAARRYGLPPESFVDFSASLNPLGPPPGVLERVAASLGDSACRYPDPECGWARNALAAHLGVPPENVLLTNGGTEAIHLAVRWWASCVSGNRPGRGRVVLPIPTFGEYARAAAAAGAPVVHVPLAAEEDFRPSVPMLTAALRPGDLLFLCNPNNPTGALLARDELLEVWRRCLGAGAFLVVDEAFLPLAVGGEGHSLAWDACRGPGLLVAGSLTKTYCLPGLRLGYLIGPADAVAAAAAYQPGWSVSAPAQEALPACLEDTGYLARARLLITTELPLLARGLATVPGLRVFPSHANFLLVDCRGTGRTAAEWRDALGRRGLLVRDCGNFPGLDPFHFRVAVRRRRENEVLLASLPWYTMPCAASSLGG